MGTLGDWFKKRKPTAAEYVEYVLDRSNDLATRDDWVGEMWQLDDPAVEGALIRMATDESEDEILVDTAGHSLWQLWQRQGRTAPEEVVRTLLPSARKLFRDDV